MSVILPSASALGVAMKCIGSAIGPQLRQEQTDAMSGGTKTHGEISEALDLGMIEHKSPPIAKALSVIFEVCHRWGLKIEDALIKTEVELSIDPATCEVVLGEMLSVDRDRFFVGAADALVLPASGAPRCCVLDWKTGAMKADSPKWNWQLIHAALSVWVASGMDDQFVCDMAIAYVDGPLKDKPVDFFSADVDFLSSRLRALENLSQRIHATELDKARLFEGQHCSICRVRDRCPAKTKALQTLALALSGEVSDPEMVQAFLIAREQYKRLEMAANTIVEIQGEVVLPNGNVARRVKWGKGTTISQANKHGNSDRKKNVEPDHEASGEEPAQGASGADPS